MSWLMEHGQVVSAGQMDGYLCNFKKSVTISANDANFMTIFGVFPFCGRDRPTFMPYKSFFPWEKRLAYRLGSRVY